MHKRYRVFAFWLTMLALVIACTPTTPVLPPVTTQPPPAVGLDALTDSSPFGMKVGLGTRYTDDADRDRAVQLLLGAGVRWLPEEFIWEGIEQPKRSFHSLQPPPGGAETATVFLLDVSGSMADTWRGGVKIESARAAALSVLDIIEQESQVGEVAHQVAVASFSSGGQLDLPLTTGYGQARQTIQSLAPGGNTNMGAGLHEANSALQSTSNARKIIILLSDGLVNEGLSRDEILSGPVQEAAQAGTCIYTVGFGEPGALDEDLLRSIAQAACGQYAYAETPYDLETIYVRVRHQSLGTVLDEYSGQVREGDTTPPRPVDVPPDQGQMHVTVNWPGSRLDTVLTDPRGRMVDANYPGVTLTSYARMVHLIITDPLPGIWQMAIRGVDVPEGIIDFNAILSVRPRIGPAPSTGTGALFAIVLLMLLVGGGMIAAILYTQRRPARRGAGALPPAGVQLIGQPGPLVGFRQGQLRIGREPICELTLSDPRISRMHAQILYTPQGFRIDDLGSTNGTFVNGQKVASQYLRHNDQIQVGDTRLVFWEQGGR